MHEHVDCTDAVERLYHYLDGELDEVRMDVVRQHLEACLPCLQAFDFEAELRQMVARRCREPVPEQLRIRITLAIQGEYGPEGFGRGMPPFG